MFGNYAAFIGGKMFLGVFGETIFVRLAEEDREKLLRQRGARVFEPTRGRPMKEYVTLPASWRSSGAEARKWVGRSRDWVAALAPRSKPSKRIKSRTRKATKRPRRN